MTNVWLTIPSGTRRKYLNDIIKDSNIPGERIVLVNTVDCEPTPGVRNVWDLDPPNIHRWWNTGIDIARENGGEYIAVLNDDLVLRNDPINKIVKGMIEKNAVLGYPHPHSGNGITRTAGYCWVLNLSYKIKADETYRWYFGDDDISLQAMSNGIVTSVAADVEHRHPLIETKQSKYLTELTIADRKYFIEKWSNRFKRQYKFENKDEPLMKQLIKLGLNQGWIFPEK